MGDERCCQDCMGMGVYAVHADNCADDLCSLGAGEWDCRWSVVDCETCGGTGEYREPERHYREANAEKRRAEESLQQVPF